jgi:TetR/AcrR family transcriptional regulator, acrAB operon repressor
MRKTKEEAAITRQRVLQAALTTFSQQGYAATTLEAVAEAAGVTRGAIYWHFSGKAELYSTLMQTVSARSRVVVEQALAEGGTVLEVVRRIFVRQLALIETDAELRALAEVQLFKTELTPELAPSRREQTEAGLQTVAQLAEVMRQAAAHGEVRGDLAPEEMARSFLALQNGAIHMWLVAPGAFSLKGSAEALADVLFDGLRAR